MVNTQTAEKGANAGELFGFKERGGSLGAEIGAGVVMAILAVCAVFMNMQVVGSLAISGPYAASTADEIAANGEIYASIYFFSMMASFVGTLMVGLLSKLPLTLTSSIVLSTSLISLAGAGSGLTYYNLLLVSFTGSAIFTAIAAIAPLRRFFIEALPTPVRKALPVALGLLVAWNASQLTGVVYVAQTALPSYGPSMFVGGGSAIQTPELVSLSAFSFSVDRYHPMLLVSTVSTFFALVVYLVVRPRAKHPCLTALLAGTVVFLAASILLTNVNWKMVKFTVNSILARGWMVGSEDAMQLHLGAVQGIFSVGRIFTDGLDFSVYEAGGGNVALLFANGILFFLFFGVYGSMAVLDAVPNEKKSLAEAVQNRSSAAGIAVAGANLVAALIGAPPVALGTESIAGVKDRGRSALSTFVAAGIILVSAFVWVVPAVFATVTSYSTEVNMYGHYGNVLQLLTQCSFSVADVVMMVVGISMATRSLDVNWKSLSETSAFGVTVAGALLTSNFAFGVAAGVIAFLLTRLLPKRSGAAKGQPLTARVSPQTLVLAALSLATIVLALF